MSEYKYLIVGGGIAGTSAAEVIRQNDKSGTIAIVTDEPDRLYSRILLSKPNFFLERIPFDQIWLKDSSWYEQNSISLLAQKKAVSLDLASKKVLLDDGSAIGYEKLLLAPGGYPRKWEISGGDKKGIFYLRTLTDARNIIGAVKSAKKAFCIGGGFVSFEMCDMLRLAGIEVTLVLRESYYWEPILDKISGELIEKALEKGGVKIFRNSEVVEIKGGEGAKSAILKTGEELACDMVVVGIGLTPSINWIKSAGVAVNRGILANEYLETNAQDVWAAGDAAEFKDSILEEDVQLGNWVNAQMQGRRAGFNMTGQIESFKLVSFYTTIGFGVSIAFVGDVRPIDGRKIIQRGPDEKGSYARIILKDSEVVGATLINRTQELASISKIIEKNIKVESRESELSDLNFDLKKLVNG